MEKIQICSADVDVYDSDDDHEGEVCKCSYHDNPFGFSDSSKDALEARIRNSKDELLAMIVFRIDNLALDGNVEQFETAILSGLPISCGSVGHMLTPWYCSKAT